MKIAFIYTRVSTNKQAEEGISLDAQAKQCIRKAEELGYEKTKVFKDEGYSGGLLARPALQLMLLEISRNPDIKILITQHTDRLARSVDIHRTIIEECRKNEVEVYSLTQGFLKDTPDGMLTDGVLSLLNEHQRLLIGYKTKASMEEKARGGWLPKVPPVGYLNATIKKEKIIIVDSIKAPLVKKIFKLYSTGNYNAEELNEKLYPMGFTSTRGRKMHSSKLYYLLRNRFYLGELKYGEIHVKKANHKAIIDEKLFNAVQLVMDTKNRFACRKRKYNFLLRGFIFCSECGRRYTAERNNKKNKSYYRCSNRHCLGKPKYVRQEKLEELVSEKFQQIEFTKEFIDQIVEKVKKIFLENRKELNQTKQTLINKRSGLEKNRDLTEDKLIAGVIDDDDFKRIIIKYKNQISEINEELVEIEQRRNIDMDKVQKIFLLTNDVYKAYTSADEQLQRQYLGFFWEKIDISNRKIHKAIPSKLFKAMLDLHKATLKETKKSPYEEEFFIPGRSLSKQKVRIRNVWGGKRVHNLIKVLMDEPYMTSLLEQAEMIPYLKSL